MADDIETLRLRAKAKAQSQRERESADDDSNPLWEGAKSVGSVALKAFDYAGGWTRTGVQQVADLATGNDNASWEDAKNGNAQSMGDYMEKAGVGDMGSINVPLIGPVTGRGVAGFVGDVALDPLTYLSGGLSAAAKGEKLAGIGGRLAKMSRLASEKGGLGALSEGGKIANKVLNPLEAFSKDRAGKLYDSAFKKVESKIERDTGKTGYAKLARDMGFSGTAGDFVDAIERRTGEEGSKIGATVDKLASQGATVDPTEAVSHAKGNFKSFNDTIQDFKDAFLTKKVDPETLLTTYTGAPDHIAAVKKLETVKQAFLDKASSYPNGQMPIEIAQKWRKNIGETVAEAFKPFGADVQQKLLVPFERGLAASIENSVQKNLPHGALESYLKSKAAYSQGTKDPMKILRQWGGEVKELRGALDPTEFDAILAGTAAMHGGPLGLAPLAAKKVTKAATSTWGKTTAAKNLDKFANKSGNITDPVVRAKLLEWLGQRGGNNE